MSLRQRIKAFFSESGSVVLMYHRIADLAADPWQLAVPPNLFEAQLQLLSKKYRVVSLCELQEQILRGNVKKNQVCLTFDDGYLDNYLSARPLLESYGCPATFFVTTDNLLTGEPYWWDELQELILSMPILPSSFHFEVNGEFVSCRLEDGGRITNEQRKQQDAWVWNQEPPTQRCALYFRIWEKMRLLPGAKIAEAMQNLRTYVGSEGLPLSLQRPMNATELLALSTTTNVQIGLHTHTHPVLSSQTAQEQRQELKENKRVLEEICGRSLDVMSYPHGKYDDNTLAVASEFKLKAACTTSPLPVIGRTNPLEIGRYQALHWNGSALDDFLTRTFH